MVRLYMTLHVYFTVMTFQTDFTFSHGMDLQSSTFAAYYDTAWYYSQTVTLQHDNFLQVNTLQMYFFLFDMVRVFSRYTIV